MALNDLVLGQNLAILS